MARAGISYTALCGAEPRGAGGACGEAHRPAESRLKAMAVPITSCMSEPMMAISIMSQSSTRGTWRGQRCLNPQRCLSSQWCLALGELAQHPGCKWLSPGCSRAAWGPQKTPLSFFHNTISG